MSFPNSNLIKGAWRSKFIYTFKTIYNILWEVAGHCSFGRFFPFHSWSFFLFVPTF